MCIRDSIGSVGNTQTVTFPAGGGLHMNAGNVSGSSTSTGSFGSLKATAHQGDLYIQGSSSTAKLKIRPSINTGVSELHFSRYNRDNAGYISYNHTADRMDFYAAGPAQRMYMSYSGVNINQALVVGTNITAGGNISGSSTSTGSFGRVESTRIESSDLVASSKILGPHSFQITSLGGEADIQTAGDLRLSTNTRLANDGIHLEFGAGNDLKIVHSNSGGTFSGNTNIIEDTTSVGLDFKSGLGFGFNNNIIVSGNVSGSATSTGSFGKLLGDASDPVSYTHLTLPTSDLV